ncbi:MAG TPA: glycine cleavage T C-terminal barrel domain-containing protein [Baekduia sp.]|nr:glycine cleavage T C-terminal barrel domain-containing protein [Baekduia sp.]
MDVLLVDRSELGKLAVVGPQAREFLDGQVTNKVDDLAVGSGVYAALLTPKGKMLGDMRVLRVSESELLLICERAALQSIFDVIRKALLGWDARLEKRTLELGLISLIGDASAVLGIHAPEPEHASTPFEDGFAIATETGVDLVVSAASTPALVERLVAAGATPLADADAEVLRVERGRPRYGIDLDDSVIPQEAGLNERAVSFTKGCYVGQETVARLYYKGKPNRHLRGLRLSAPIAAGATLTADEREVGLITSSVVSPRLGPIALAFVRREVQPGEQVTVAESDGTTAVAEVVELPFS